MGPQPETSVLEQLGFDEQTPSLARPFYVISTVISTVISMLSLFWTGLTRLFDPKSAKTTAKTYSKTFLCNFHCNFHAFFILERFDLIV